MNKRKNTIEFIKTNELPIKIKKFEETAKYDTFMKIERKTELSKNKIMNIDSSIKEKTDFFNYEYILNMTDDNMLRESFDINIDFTKHVNINEKMYKILLDWLFIVHCKLKANHETFFLTHQILSRYLTIEHNVKRSHLQLVGISSYFICSKYEEKSPVEIKDLIFVCDKAYTKIEIIEMEWEILSKFDFNLLYTPTVYSFTMLHSFFCGFTEEISTCVTYLCYVSTQSHLFLKYKLSEISTSVIIISRSFYMNYQHALPKELIFCSNYTLTDLSNCIKSFHDVCVNQVDPNCINVYKMHLMTKYKNISKKFESFDWNLLLSQI